MGEPAESQSFEREKLAYEQNFEHVRHLNTQMNKIPTFAVTVTGGLWFAAGLQANVADEIRFGLLVFAGIANVALALISYRILAVLSIYLDKLGSFYKPAYATAPPGREKKFPYFRRSMVFIYASMMFLAAAMSFIGALLFWPFPDVSRWIGFGVLVVLVVGYTLLVIRFEPKNADG